MDYDLHGRSKYHHSSAAGYANGAGNHASSSRVYQERDPRAMRSHQGMEAGDARQQSQRSSSRKNSSRASSRSSGQHGGYTSPNGRYYEQQAPLTQYENGHSNTVTPNPPHEVTNSAAHVSGGHHQSRRPAYLLHRDLVIGKGSYGQVCIASRGEAEGQHSSSGKRKKFACKCVVLRNDAKYIAKLQEEVNVLRELRGHENVIRLYDVFCVDNELFIITELGRGGDLFHLLTTHPKHGVTEAYAGKFLCLPYLVLYLFLMESNGTYFFLQQKLYHKCFQLLLSCILDKSVTEI